MEERGRGIKSKGGEKKKGKKRGQKGKVWVPGRPPFHISGYATGSCC